MIHFMKNLAILGGLVLVAASEQVLLRIASKSP